MARVNTASIASQLQAMGFTMAGAYQLIAAQVLSDAKDRRRLTLLLAGLFEANVIQGTHQGGRSVVQTRSGIQIEFQDDAGNASNQGSQSGGPSSSPSTSRTRSGIRVSFEDDA
jgi:hypothetical protein